MDTSNPTFLNVGIPRITSVDVDNPETSEHLLLSCRELKEARKESRAKRPGLRLSLSILSHTKQGIIETLNFLRKTGIATKKWHLNRRDEESEESEEEGARE
jgi:hypothetical protein